LQASSREAGLDLDRRRFQANIVVETVNRLLLPHSIASTRRCERTQIMRPTILTLILLCSTFTLVLAQDKVKVDEDQNYLVLSTKRIQTMEKELEEVARKGFRVMYGAPTQSFDMAILLQRASEAKDEPYGYKILATSRNKTMQKELNEFASEGYRLLPRTIVSKQGLFTSELLMIMERDPRVKNNYEYKLVTGGKETKLHKKIDEAMAEGFVPVTMVTIGDHVVVMERESRAAQTAGKM
jgi:hypothetical protein